MTEETFTNFGVQFGKELFSTLQSMKSEIEQLTTKVSKLEIDLKAAKEKEKSKYVFTNEACDMLQISKSSFAKLWSKGVFKRHRNLLVSGNRNYFLRAEIEAVRDNVTSYDSQ